LGYDGSLDVVGIHRIGGVLGILATSFFASKAINSACADGLVFGNPAQFETQAVTVIAGALFSFVGTFVVLKLVDGMAGWRFSGEDEALGLDLSQHNERAYS
jgi:Amt family ammonium transporter